jgi:hypothetical protein
VGCIPSIAPRRFAATDLDLTSYLMAIRGAKAAGHAHPGWASAACGCAGVLVLLLRALLPNLERQGGSNASTRRSSVALQPFFVLHIHDPGIGQRFISSGVFCDLRLTFWLCSCRKHYVIESG